MRKRMVQQDRHRDNSRREKEIQTDKDRQIKTEREVHEVRQTQRLEKEK